MIEGQNVKRANLTVDEMQAIFRAGLEEELAIAASDLAAPRKIREADSGSGELFVAAYEAIRHVRADADHVPS
ncbi:MAG TPA: hypothetical protein DDZ54_03960, partial [Erythrobacter sp.]|nr:hypothetical protein [Erythrobacter sp.]